MLGYKRLQFNIIVRKVSRFAPMKNLHAMLFPIFWVDEVRLRTIIIILGRRYYSIVAYTRIQCH
jgi:hypothetical protein